MRGFHIHVQNRNQLISAIFTRHNFHARFWHTEQVFLQHSENKLIALSHNFREYLDTNVIFSQSSLGTHSEGYKSGELLEKFMKGLRVECENRRFITPIH